MGILGRAGFWAAYKCLVIQLEEAAAKILEAAEERGVDLIVLGVHRRKRCVGAATHLPMTTGHKVVSQTACPVLTVRG